MQLSIDTNSTCSEKNKHEKATHLNIIINLFAEICYIWQVGNFPIKEIHNFENITINQ